MFYALLFAFGAVLSIVISFRLERKSDEIAGLYDQCSASQETDMQERLDHLDRRFVRLRRGASAVEWFGVLSLFAAMASLVRWLAT